MPLPSAVEKLLQDVDKKLHEDNSVTNLLAQIEAKAGIKRLHLVLGLVGIHALYLMFGSLAELLCDIIGFIYPAYVSIRSIETSYKDDGAQWLIYWIIFALFNIAEYFSETFVVYFPLYWLLKCIFLLYLYLPMTRGAQKIYYRFIQSIVQKHQSALEKQMGRVTEKLTDKLDENIEDRKSILGLPYRSCSYNSNCFPDPSAGGYEENSVMKIPLLFESQSN